MGELLELRHEHLALQDRRIKLLEKQIDLSKEMKEDREMPVGREVKITGLEAEVRRSRKQERISTSLEKER